MPRAGKTDTRKQILSSALKLFSAKGYSASLDDIALDAGVTKGAIYWHFKGKEDLFVNLCRVEMGALNDYIEEKIKGTESPSSILSFIMLSSIEYAHSHKGIPALIRIIMNENFEETSGIFKGYLEDEYSRWGKFLADIIRRGIKCGEFRPVSPKETAYMLMALMDGIWLHDTFLAGSYEARRVVKESISVILSGIGSPGKHEK